MNRPLPAWEDRVPAIRRLEGIAALDAPALTLLHDAVRKATAMPPRRELLSEGRRVPPSLLMLEGWAARVKIMVDGRRMLVGFVLPGDIIGHCAYDGAISTSTVVALTDVAVCPLPMERSPSLERAYAISRALGEAYLAAQIIRLGRLDAGDRIIDLLLELHERLSLAGLTRGGTFEFPLTQEAFGDALGLTSVHVNRMVQQARKRGELHWAERSVTLIDVDRLRDMIGREMPRVV